MTATRPDIAAATDALAAALAPDLVAIVGHLATQAHDAAQPAAVTSGARQAPGVVKVRLSGTRADIEAVTAVLAGHCQVLDRSGPRPNRYEPGERVYLTIRTGPAPVGPDHRA